MLCFFPNPFDEAAVLTADGVEWATTTVAIGKKTLEIKEIHFPIRLDYDSTFIYRI